MAGIHWGARALQKRRLHDHVQPHRSACLLAALSDVSPTSLLVRWKSDCNLEGPVNRCQQVKGRTNNEDTQCTQACSCKEQFAGSRVPRDCVCVDVSRNGQKIGWELARNCFSRWSACSPNSRRARLQRQYLSRTAKKSAIVCTGRK